MHAKRAFLALMLLILLPTSAKAAEDLYSGEIAVSGQGVAERDRAVPLALLQVLGKLSGLRDFEAYPELQPALDRASAMLLSYHYRNAERLLSDGEKSSELRLVARFSPPEVDRLAREFGLPLWPPERTPVTAWLIIDDGLERRILPLEYEYTRFALDDAAARRGLSLAWPQADEEGVYAVDEQLLWGGYTEDIASADGSGVLILAARREGPQWSVRFNLGAGGQHLSWRRDDVDLERALVDGLEEVIDQLAAGATIAAEDLGSWTEELVVAGIGHAGDYARCLGLLQGISIVRQVGVVSARPGEVRFRLELSAAPRYLESALAADARLEAGDAPGQWRLASPLVPVMAVPEPAADEPGAGEAEAEGLPDVPGSGDEAAADG